MGRKGSGRVRREGRPRAGPSAGAGGRDRGGLLRGTESWKGVEYVVQPSAGKLDRVYRCPGCDHELDGTTSHLVVWPADLPDGVAGRRHWHTYCWRSRPGAR